MISKNDRNPFEKSIHYSKEMQRKIDLSLEELCSVFLKKCQIKQEILNSLKTKEDILPPMLSAKEQTKDWRKSQTWYQNGKQNECELYQREWIERITGQPCPKTNVRIHLEKLLLEEKTKPLLEEDGFEWTENFDGLQIIHNRRFYYNLKMVCDQGGAQTRSLREVYLFIKGQIAYLQKNPDPNLYFINILDGNGSAQRSPQFDFITKDHPQVFCQDMKTFQTWFQSKKEEAND